MFGADVRELSIFIGQTSLYGDIIGGFTSADDGSGGLLYQINLEYYTGIISTGIYLDVQVVLTLICHFGG